VFAANRAVSPKRATLVHLSHSGFHFRLRGTWQTVFVGTTNFGKGQETFKSVNLLGCHGLLPAQHPTDVGSGDTQELRELIPPANLLFEPP
jgi:hypothetical protein